MDYLEKKNSYPNDRNIVFYENTHKYYVGGKEYKSVTKKISTIFPPFDGEEIKSRMINKKRTIDDIYYNKTKEQIQEMWDLSRQLGVDLHLNIEKHLNGVCTDVTFPTDVSYQYFLNFMKDYKLIPWRTEFKIYDNEFKIAGSIDALFKDNDGNFIIVDWKRVKELDQNNTWNKFSNEIPNIGRINDTKYEHYRLQLSIYSYILEKNYGIIPTRLALVLLHPENDNYVLHSVSYKKELVQEILKTEKS